MFTFTQDLVRHQQTFVVYEFETHLMQVYHL